MFPNVSVYSSNRMKGNEETENDLVEAFKVFDKDQDGSITQDELRSVMANLGQKLTSQELDEMIKEADTDGDGKINYKEFVKMMVSLFYTYIYDSFD